LSQPSTRRIVAAGTIGNILEWYDFAIYGYFASQIGRAFFPQESAVAQLLSAFGIFAVGYLMRPLGAILLGHIGDKYGRRTALTVSVAAMAIPTFLVGVLPGYAVLGIMAPVLLTFLRMVQGLSVGGEYTTSIVFMVEHAPPHRRGFIGSIGESGALLGMLLGSATGSVLGYLLPAAAMDEWGWRIPFLCGLLLGLVGFFLRRHMPESAPEASADHSPAIEIFRHHRALLVRLAGLAIFGAIGFYVVFVYVVSWLQIDERIGTAQALGINTISMIALLPITLATGWLSDRIGRKPMIYAALVIAFLGAIPFFALMSGWAILIGQLGLTLAVGLFSGTLPTLMVESAPVRVRCTVVALGYNVTLGLIGGLTPLVATWLVYRTGDLLSPAYLIMGAAVLSFITLFFFKETYRSPLEAHKSPAA
jgi:MHS family proline/betaine transporter-like MFS transporter